MFQARPNLPLIPKPGDPIRAEFLASLVGMAGYFEGKPIDPFTLGEGIFIGRPALMKVASLEWGGSDSKAWDGGKGSIYGLTNAAILEGSDGGSYAAIQYDDDEYPGISLAEVNGGASSVVGDFVFSMPVQTPSGMVFVFQPSSGSASGVYRPVSPTVIIPDRRWSYTLMPQILDPETNEWDDDPDGEPLDGAMNLAEALNGEDGLQGNDVDFSLPPFADPAMQLPILNPIGENRLVVLIPVKTKASGSSSSTGGSSGSGPAPKRYWFTADNVVQQPCIDQSSSAEPPSEAPSE